MVRIATENRNQEGFCPFALRKVSVLPEPSLGHLRYCLTDVPPQPNSPPNYVLLKSMGIEVLLHTPSGTKREREALSFHKKVSRISLTVVVFQGRLPSHLCYTCQDILQS